MSIVHEFKYTVAEGYSWIELDDWVNNLPDAERQEFRDAERRQREFRSQAIADGRLVLDESHLGDHRQPGDQPRYVWSDPETAKQNKPEDIIWRQYFDRWMAENGISIEVIEREI